MLPTCEVVILSFSGLFLDKILLNPKGIEYILYQVKSSHLYLYSAFNNTNYVKATAQYQNGKIVYHYSKMTRLNAHFSVKGISLLNSVMSSSSSVQFKLSLCNQVGDIAGNEVSPTKQTRGDNGKKPKLHR